MHHKGTKTQRYSVKKTGMFPGSQGEFFVPLWCIFIRRGAETGVGLSAMKSVRMSAS